MTGVGYAIVDEEQVRLIVRVTARLSAIVFLAALGLFAARYGARPRRVGGATNLLISFLVVHTIHFGAVLSLAVLTAGANIRERGGWPAMTGVAAAFYLSALGILRMWRDVASDRPVSHRELLAAHIGVLFIATIFLNSYVSRVGTMPVYWLWTASIVLVVAAYLVCTRPMFGPPKPSGADDRVGG